MKRENYDPAISTVRLIAMCMIIITHLLSYYKNPLCNWFNVGVQVFLCMSGYLYGSRSSSGEGASFIIKNCKKILTDYLMFQLIYMTCYVMLAQTTFTISIKDQLLCNDFLPGSGHLWFIPYILFCYVITPILFDLKKALTSVSIQRGALTGALLIGIIIGMKVLHVPYKIEDVMAYVIGFFLGDIPHEKMDLKNKGIWLLTGMGMLFNALIWTGFAKRMLPQSLYQHYYDSSHTLMGITVFIFLYALFRKIQWKRIERVLRFSDKYSYDVYLVHQVFILGTFSMCGLTGFRGLNISLTLLVIFLCSIILWHLCRGTEYAITLLGRYYEKKRDYRYATKDI